MTDDLTAARERHVKGAEPALCHHDPLNYPCDAARFRDGMDALKEQYLAMVEAWSKASQSDQAARALADELAEHLQRAIHDLIEDWEPSGPQMRYDAARAALAKWEASK